MAQSRVLRIWRIIEIAVAAISVLSFAFAVGLSYQYVSTRPLSPEPTTGRMYRHEIHGQISFVNSAEKRNLNFLFWTAGVAFACAIAIDYYIRPFSKKT
jgi:hypothetical protein